ncbi:MAG: TlpA disulfide reductase family protein [Gammaproteobacteria bacterium]
MNKKRYGLWAGFIVLCFVLGGGLYWGYYASHQSKKPAVRKPLSMLNQPRPDFTLSDIRNKPHDIRQWDGKVILLNFWATWCPPCRHEMPAMERLYQHFRDKGFVVLAVNQWEDPDLVFAYTGELNVFPSFPILFDPQSTVSQDYGVKGLPTSFVIDRDGRLVYRAIGGRDFDHPEILQRIGDLLAESP